MNLDENYQDWGRMDLIVQKLQRIVPVYSEEASQLKIQNLREYLDKNNTKIIDAPEKAMVVQNRLLFLKNLHRAVEQVHTRYPDDYNA